MLVKGCSAKNIFFSGKINALKGCDASVVDELLIRVDINGLQMQQWNDLSLGYFNLRVKNPVLSCHFPSIVTISVTLKNIKAKKKKPKLVLLEVCKMIRFSNISVDKYKIPLSVEYK